MQIKITTTLDISTENAGLIGVVSATLGYDTWKENKIEKARSLALAEWEGLENTEENPRPEFSFDETTVSVTANEFIIEFLGNDYKLRLKNLVEPAITSYFGGVMAKQAEVVKGQLGEAINCDVTIDE